jgi:hypothetical protein
MRKTFKTESEKKIFLENLLKGVTNNETIDYNNETIDYNSTKLWYKLSREIVTKNGGRSLFNEGKSLFDILQKFYPQNNLYAWLFEKGNVPLNYWENIENHKLYINWYLELKGLKVNDVINYEGCYKIKNEELCKEKGGSLINLKYEFSVYSLLKVTIEYDWLPWKFTNAPNNFWSGENKKQNAILYLNWLFDVLEFSSKKDFYKLNKNHFINNYGGGLLGEFNGKIMDMLIFAFPNDDKWSWQFWRFGQVQKNIWKNSSNQKEFMNYVHTKLFVNSQEEMYYVSSIEISNFGGSSLVTNYYDDNIYKLYKNVYSDLKWDKNKFYHSNKTETKIYNSMKETFSRMSNDDYTININREYCVNWCKNAVSGKHFRYDFIIKIAFDSFKEIYIIMELDGEQHFEFCNKNNIYNRKLSYIERHNRDLFKMNLAIENNYHFIRLFQPDVWYDNVDWKNEVISTINCILLNSKIPIIKYISKDDIYENFNLNWESN